MPLALRGPYAIFVYSFGGVRLRLSGDLRSDRISAAILGKRTRGSVRRAARAFMFPTPASCPAHSWERLHVWLEGIPMGEVELYLDDRLINRFAGPPYLLGNQDRSGDSALPRGEHTLRVRARDGAGWPEQTFRIVSAG